MSKNLNSHLVSAFRNSWGDWMSFRDSWILRICKQDPIYRTPIMYILSSKRTILFLKSRTFRIGQYFSTFPFSRFISQTNLENVSSVLFTQPSSENQNWLLVDGNCSRICETGLELIRQYPPLIFFNVVFLDDFKPGFSVESPYRIYFTFYWTFACWLYWNRILEFACLPSWGFYFE